MPVGLLHRALDLLLPPQCPTCDVIVDRNGRLCAACFRAIAFITPPLCQRCGVPFAYAAQAADGICPDCAASPPAFRCARGALRYDEASRRLVLPFKYGDRLELVRVLAPAMARSGGALLARADLLAPVPLHRRRLLARRYNQAAMLARAVADLADKPVQLDLLRRRRATAPLAEKTSAERAAEVADVFVADGRWVAGRVVLLIDDIMTSGATANACARCLLSAGAAAVDVLVAARVPNPQLL